MVSPPILPVIFLQITTADPAETAQARNVAILHVCVESVGILFCRSPSCFWAALFAIPSSSTVACCCKTRCNYTVWGLLGGLVFCLHVAAASTYAPDRSGYFSGESSGFNVMVQVFLSFVSMLVAHFGIRMAWRLRNPILPAEVQLGAMEVAPPRLNPPTELHFAEARRSP